MKKILHGKRYDSSNAIIIGGHYASCSISDFSYWEATLYKTPRSSQYFLVGEGGPMSRFAQSAGQNQWTGGSDLIPMIRKEALEWACEHLDADVVDKEFSDIIEDA